MSELPTLLGLAAVLRGEPPRDLDWRATVELANRAFLTPALQDHVEPAPPEIRTFVAEVARRNAERNRRLASQLREVVEILWAAGIECTLLKGAALLVATDPEQLRRLISDLDLMVAPAQADAAVDALAGAGFRTLTVHGFDDSHVAAELCRDADVGMVDLHRRAPGPRRLLTDPRIAGRTSGRALGAATVQVPAIELQLLHLAMHDQFHDGDYWSGALDLRHLYDTASLIARAEPVDWTLFDADLLGGFARRAALRQLYAANRLFGAAVPEALLRDPTGAAQYWRARAQLGNPWLRAPLSAANLLLSAPSAYRHYRSEARWRAAAPHVAPTQERRRGRIARLRDAFSPARAAKI